MAFGKYSGEETEKMLLGAIEREQTVKHPERFESFKKDIIPYLSFRESLKHVRDMQPYDPAYPVTRSGFAEDLVDRVKRYHGLARSDRGVRIYTAVTDHEELRTLLDVKHHFDAVLAIDAPGGSERLLTIDVTANPKEAAHKVADIIVLWPSEGIDMDNEPDAWEERMRSVMGQVLTKITN